MSQSGVIYAARRRILLYSKLRWKERQSPVEKEESCLTRGIVPKVKWLVRAADFLCHQGYITSWQADIWNYRKWQWILFTPQAVLLSTFKGICWRLITSCKLPKYRKRYVSYCSFITKQFLPHSRNSIEAHTDAYIYFKIFDEFYTLDLDLFVGSLNRLSTEVWNMLSTQNKA